MQRTCKKCGRVFSEKFSFCPECGSHWEQPAPMQETVIIPVSASPVVTPVDKKPVSPVKPVKKPEPRKKLFLGILAAVLVIALAVGGLFGYKLSQYNQGMALEAEGSYALAVEAYEKAGNFRDAAQRLEYCAKGVHFLQGQEAYAQGEYVLAAEEFGLAEDFPEADAREQEAGKAEHYRLGQEAFAREDYVLAGEEFSAAGDYMDAATMAEEARKGACYQDALTAMGNGDYSGALIFLEDAGDFEGVEAAYRECNYREGLRTMDAGDLVAAVAFFEDADGFGDSMTLLGQCLDRKGRELLAEGNLTQAKPYFEKLCTGHSSDYPDSANYLAICEAEALLAKGDLKGGMDQYYGIPSTFRPQEFDLAKRLKELKTYEPFYALCGRWNSKTYDITAREVSGGWVRTCYYPAGKLKDMYMDVSCTLNSDGTVDMKISANFYYFTEYPSAYGYQDKVKTVNFTVPGLRYLPGTWTIDDDTIFRCSGGVLRITYGTYGSANCFSDVTYDVRE